MSLREDMLGLPRQLDDGLLLRWATRDDAEELAAFNIAMHSDNPEEPQEFLGHWTRDLMSGIHPTTDASDFTVVVDTRNGNKIVSSLNLISQEWSYAGIPIPVGRPELVATHPDYRRRGLVRHQMETIHALSAARGEMMNAITGIPWYYRQFDYEMAIDLGGSRQFFWVRPGNSEVVDEEPYQIRKVTPEDITLLDQLYTQHTAGDLLVRVRTDEIWQYELFDAHPEANGHANIEIIESADGVPVAYAAFQQWGTAFVVQELGVMPGHSWRAVALFLTREFKRRADEVNRSREEPITNVSFSLGVSHPVYSALGGQLEHQIRPYAYYVRVPDIPALLRHIAPVLENRLAASVLAGHTGTLKINLYRQRLALVWKSGKLREIGTFAVKRLEDGDIRFPNLTFLQILFGYRSFEELYHAHADCYDSNAEARLLAEVLFPKIPSNVRPLD